MVDRFVRGRLALLVAVVAVAVGLAVTLSQARGSGPTSEVTGVVVAVDSQGLGNVRGFTLRLAGGEQMVFSLRALQNGTSFAPGHLSEHQATAARVRVAYRVEGTERLAILLEDTPPASPS